MDELGLQEVLLKQRLGLELWKEKGEQKKKIGLFLELKDMVAVGCLMKTCFEVENRKVL